MSESMNYNTPVGQLTIHGRKVNLRSVCKDGKLVENTVRYFCPKHRKQEYLIVGGPFWDAVLDTGKCFADLKLEKKAKSVDKETATGLMRVMERVAASTTRSQPALGNIGEVFALNPRMDKALDEALNKACGVTAD